MIGPDEIHLNAVSSPLNSKRISFFSTNMFDAKGGIASANRNVFFALDAIAASNKFSFEACVLHGSGCLPDGEFRSKVTYKTYGGDKFRMGRDIFLALFFSEVVIFDHVHLAAPLGFLSRCRKIVRAKTVIFAHGSESWKNIRALSMGAFRSADLVLTNSHYTLNKMNERFAGFRALPCPLGLSSQFNLNKSPPQRSVERPVLRAADGSSRAISERAMLLVGRMDAGEREKGHRELIAVLPQVCKLVPDAELVFVGGGSDAEAIAAIAAASPSASNIFLTGAVDDQLLTEVYGAAYAYVMPSRQEGFGLVYLEAMNHALPCLACHEDGAADVVVDGVTGVLVRQPIDENELTTAIVGLLSNPGRARELGEAGWRRLNEHFTAEAHQARVKAALEPLLR